MGHLQKKMEKNVGVVDKGSKIETKAPLRREVNIDEIS
jgi:hypothetical protein